MLTSLASPIRRTVATLLALACLATLPAAAAAQTTVFGKDGQRFQVHEDLYRKLFPEGGHGVRRAHPVLALDVQRGAESERWLVPGTEGAERDTHAVLVLERESGAVHLLWATETEEGAHELWLTRFDGEGWGDRIEVSGDAGALKSAPQVRLTRDQWGSEERPRTVAHLVWSEEQSGLQYTPIVLVEGRYLGWNPVVRLDDLDPSEPSGSASALLERPLLLAGEDGRTLVVAFVSHDSGHLLTLRLRLLPWTLTDLADQARSHITVVGARTEGSILGLAEQARSHITVVGGDLHRGAVGYIADQSYLEVLSWGPLYESGDVGEIAQRVWQSTVTAGASILGNDLHSDGLACQRLELGASSDAAVEVLHLFEMCLLATRAMPPLGSDPQPFVSEDGERVLLTWIGEDGQLYYRLDTGDGWSEERLAPTDESFGPAAARQALVGLIETE